MGQSNDQNRAGLRAGGRTLTLLGIPRVVAILRCLEEGARGRRDLRGATDFPPQSTLRGLLATLEEVGAVVRRDGSAPPRALEYELAGPGRDLLPVADSLGSWLAAAPNGARELGGNSAKASVRGIVDGWSATILIKLAGGPLSLTTLAKQVSTASYSTIERALATMRIAGQLDIGPRSSRGAPYSLNDWIRRGFGPLALAARWEHRHRPKGAVPIQRLDLESACTIVSPLLDAPARLAGACRVSAGRGAARPAEATIVAREGHLSLAAAGYATQPDAFASGSVDAWFSALIEGEIGGLALSGDAALASGFVLALHRTLFARREPELAVPTGSVAFPSKT